jgi:hypothetical protein
MQAVPPQPLLLFDDEAAAAAGDAAACIPGLGPEPVPLNHYLQNMISPRSRSEYDEFNRFHFSRLKQQGRDKRAITPKVGTQGVCGMCTAFLSACTQDRAHVSSACTHDTSAFLHTHLVSVACCCCCCCQVGEDPMNRTEAAAYQQEMRSPRVSAEVASRARSPEVRTRDSCS